VTQYATRTTQYAWAAVLAILMLSVPAALSARPELRELDDSVPRSARTGEQYTFHIQYRDSAGDRPVEAMLVTEGPDGVHRWPAEGIGARTVNYKNPTILDFTAGPFPSGDYHAHFEVASVADKVRYPATGSGLLFTVEDVLLKWIELIIGLAVALLFLPLITFVLVRSVNPSSDPSRAARFGLLVGIVASYALFVFLFSALYALPWIIVIGILALGLLFALAPRRV
jgi:hypothetical protein